LPEVNIYLMDDLYHKMLTTEVDDHKDLYRKMPTKSSPDDQLPFDVVTPGEVDLFIKAAAGIGGSPGFVRMIRRYMPGLPLKGDFLAMTIYGSLSRMSLNAEPLTPEDYIEVLWPTKERIDPCIFCRGKGERECQKCGGRGFWVGSECDACEGDGWWECDRCEGSKGTKSGLCLTIAKLQDDWFVVTFITYDDTGDEEANRLPIPITAEYYMCDQVRGVVSLLGMKSASANSSRG
jgi:hypothetical protein